MNSTFCICFIYIYNMMAFYIEWKRSPFALEPTIWLCSSLNKSVARCTGTLNMTVFLIEKELGRTLHWDPLHYKLFLLIYYQSHVGSKQSTLYNCIYFNWIYSILSMIPPCIYIFLFLARLSCNLNSTLLLLC